MSEWKEVTNQSTIVRWTQEPKDENDPTIFIGDIVEGKYKDKRENLGKKNGVMYVIETKEHGLVGVWGSIVLNDKFGDIPVGMEVRIENLGMTESKKGDEYRNFRVFSRQAPMSEVKPEVAQEPVDDGMAQI